MRIASSGDPYLFSGTPGIIFGAVFFEDDPIPDVITGLSDTNFIELLAVESSTSEIVSVDPL